MGSFGFYGLAGINEGVERFRETANAVLLDVRSRQEYAAGHIPGSLNLPVEQIEAAADDIIPDLQTPVFIYCLSGARSARAASVLAEMGYQKVGNIGGVGGYRGELAAGS